MLHCSAQKEKNSYEDCDPAAQAAVPGKSCRGRSEGYFLNEDQCGPVAAVAQYFVVVAATVSHLSVRPSVRPLSLHLQSTAVDQSEQRARDEPLSEAPQPLSTTTTLCLVLFLCQPTHTLTRFNSSGEHLDVGVATGSTRKWNSRHPCPLLQPEPVAKQVAGSIWVTGRRLKTLK